MLQKTIRIAKTNSMNHHAKIKGRSTNQLLGTLWPRNNAKLNIDKKDRHQTTTVNIDIDI